MLLEAEWVLPIDAPAIARGGVLVRDGVIVEVGPAAELRARHGATDEMRVFPGCLLMPGFVNTHSHLEYSAFHGFSPSCGFGEWMLRLLLARRKLSPDDYAVSALWGAHECARSGITCVADTSFEGWTSLRAAGQVGLRGRVYVEVIGLDEGAIPEIMERTEQRVAALEAERPPLVEIGLSPHAPYTVSQRLYRELARFARRRSLWTATHVAESRAEVELLQCGTGSIARAYRAAHLWKGRRWQAPGLRPAAYVAAGGGLTPTTLAVHCVQLDADDVAAVARTGAAVAHCPRSNARLQCDRAPIAELRAAGVRVGLGTDSLASNDSLDMFAEMRAARQAGAERARDGAALFGPYQPPCAVAAPLASADVLRMATLDGAHSLGLGDHVGSLRPGKRADIIAVRLPAGRDGATPDPAATPGSGGAPAQTWADGVCTALVERAAAADVVATFVDGRLVYEGRLSVESDLALPHPHPSTGLSMGPPAELEAAFDAVRARLGLGPFDGSRTRA